MAKERKFDGVWNAEKVLASYMLFANEDGCIPYIENNKDTTDGIRRQRFYAALRAYGKIESNYLMDYDFYSLDGESHTLLSKKRSLEKMKEFRELLKQNLYADYNKKYVDSPDFHRNEYDVLQFFRELFRYRKKLYKLSMVWGGVWECSRSIGLVIETTTYLHHKQIRPVCEVIDRMLILLMGDDYDKSFTEKELFQYGYPDVTDEELYQMEIKEEW